MTEQELPQKLDLKSMDIAQNRIDELRAIFPEVVTEGKIDFDALKRALGEWVEPNRERFGLNWIGKAECMKVIQQPSIGTLNPDLGESVDFQNTNNIFIEGDNLEVLKLLQKSYFGKIKMIYIDPPYNTGKEFLYPDKFSENLDTYLEYSGQKDSQGRKFSTNTDTSGRYHTNWLNMMYPRLYLARNLLREDGVIFISIDDNEQANLKALCDQIFGEENFIANIIWQKKTGASDAKTIATITEYILLYCNDQTRAIPKFSKNTSSYDLARYKFKDEFFNERGPYYIDNLDRGGLQYSDSLNYGIICPDGSISFPNGRKVFRNDGWIWKWSKSKIVWALENNFLEFRKSNSKESGWSVCYKNYLLVDNEGNSIERAAPHKNLILDVLNANASQDLKELFNTPSFSYPKPIDLIKKLVSFISCQKNDIILDFFAGSSTAAHAIMRQNSEDEGNRKFIMVQLPEPCDETSEAYKAGFKTIADISRERIRRAGKKIKEEASSKLDLSGNGEIDVGFKAFKLTNSNFKVWDGNIDNDEAVVKQLELNVHNIIDDRNDLDFVFEILLKSGFALDTKIENIKNLGEHVYGIANNELIICLEKEITKQMIDAIADYDPIQVICLDAGFNGNDQLKTNAVQTFKSKAKIDFKTV